MEYAKWHQHPYEEEPTPVGMGGAPEPGQTRLPWGIGEVAPPWQSDLWRQRLYPDEPIELVAARAAGVAGTDLPSPTVEYVRENIGERWGVDRLGTRAVPPHTFSPERQAELIEIGKRDGMDAVRAAMTPEEREMADKQRPYWLRVLGAVLGTGLDVLNAPAWVVEEALGGAMQTYDVKMPPIFTPGKYLTPEQQAEVDRRMAKYLEEHPDVAGMGGAGPTRYEIEQQVWLEGARVSPGVQEYAIETYGDTPETEAALNQLRVVAYSPYQAQIQMLDGLMAGEDLDTLMNGREVRGYTDEKGEYRYSPEDQAAFNAYIAGIYASGGDVAAAVDEVQRTGYIPPRTDPWNEMVLQIVIDPLNLLDLAGGVAKGGRAAKAGSRFGDVASELAEVAAKAGDEAVEVLGEAAKVVPPSVMDEVAGLFDEAGELVDEIQSVIKSTVDEMAEAAAKTGDDVFDYATRYDELEAAAKAGDIDTLVDLGATDVADGVLAKAEPGWVSDLARTDSLIDETMQGVQTTIDAAKVATKTDEAAEALAKASDLLSGNRYSVGIDTTGHYQLLDKAGAMDVVDPDTVAKITGDPVLAKAYDLVRNGDEAGLEVLGYTDGVQGVIGEIGDALNSVPEVANATEIVADTKTAELVRLVFSPDNIDRRTVTGRLAYWWRNYGFGPSACAAVRTRADEAFEVVAGLTRNLKDPNSALQILTDWVADPTSIKGFGNLPISPAARDAIEIIAPILDDLSSFKSVQKAFETGRFSPTWFLKELDTHLFLSAMDVLSVAAEPLGKRGKAFRWFMNTMSNLYLKLSGYAIRNMLGDLVTMGFDGKLIWTNPRTIDDFLTAIGPTTARIVNNKARGLMGMVDVAARYGDEVAAGADEAVEVIQTGRKTILGIVSDKISDAYKGLEEWRYKVAFAVGLDQELAQVWHPNLPQELAQMLTPKQADDLTQALAHAYNPREFWKAIVDTVPDGKWGTFWRWAKDALTDEWNTVLSPAIAVAKAHADFCLLDYMAKERGVDAILRVISPFSFWSTRSAVNWVARFLDHPGVGRAYAEFKAYRVQQNLQKGYPSKYAGAVEIQPPWTDDSVMLYPERMISPPAQLYGPIVGAATGGYYDQPDSTTEKILDTYELSGLRLNPLIEIALYALGLVDNPSEIQLLVPYFRLSKGFTAMMGIGGPRGIDIEGMVRESLDLRAEPYEGGHIGTRLSAMAADDPERTEDVYGAQALNQGVEDGLFSLDDAMGQNGDVEAVTQFAQERGWTDEQLANFQGLLVAAAHLDAVESGVKAIASSLFGTSMDILPAGEKKQYELQGDRRVAMYSPLTGEGSREGLQEFQKEHSEAGTWGTRWPKEESEEGYTAADALANLQYSQDVEKLIADHEAERAAFIKANPWDKDGLRKLDEAHYEAKDYLWAFYHPGEQEPGAPAAVPQAVLDLWGGQPPEVIGAEPAGEKPWSTFGATPEEAADTRNRQVMHIVAQNKPQADDYEDEDGEIDWDAWRAAEAEYFATLVDTLADDPTIVALADEMGVTPTELLTPITQEAYNQHKLENDTITEAAQAAWYETVYGDAWNRYHKDVERGVSKSTAWRRHIEPAIEVEPAALIKAIQEMYPGRWTTHELVTELEGMETFPSVEQASFLRKSPEEQAVKTASNEYHDYVGTVLAPGERTNEWLYDIPSVQYIMDPANKGKLTAEDYEKALADAKAAFLLQDRSDWGSSARQQQAREEDAKFQDYWVEQTLPGVDVKALQKERRELSPEAQEIFDAQHPELQDYYDLRSEYAETHPVWAEYYITNKSRFWTEVNENMPPGWRSNDVYDDPAVRAAMDAAEADEDNRALWGKAYEAVLAYIEQHQATWPGNPEEWAEVRALDKQMKAQAAEAIPGLQDILDGYYDTPEKSAERQQYVADHPEMQQYWDARDKFGAENPLWAKYYDTPRKIKSGAWDYVHEKTPPGWRSSGLYDNELMDLLDEDDITGEQLAQITAWVDEWVAGQDTTDWGTEDAWAEARRLNTELERILGELLPGIDTIMDMYYDTEPASEMRKAFKQAHPEIQTYFDMRDAWGALPANAIWAYYYLRPDQYGKGKGGKGGGGQGGWVWDEFYRQAHDVPRVFLDTPSPWEGALRFPKFEYESPFRLDWKQRLRWS